MAMQWEESGSRSGSPHNGADNSHSTRSSLKSRSPSPYGSVKGSMNGSFHESLGGSANASNLASHEVMERSGSASHGGSPNDFQLDPRNGSPTSSPRVSPRGSPKGSPKGTPQLLHTEPFNGSQEGFPSFDLTQQSMGGEPPIESSLDSSINSPMGSPSDSPVGSRAESPSGFSDTSPIGSRTASPINGSSTRFQVESRQTSVDATKPPPPAFGQSVILNKVPRYERLTVDQPQKVSDGSSSYVSYLVTAQQYPEEKPERVRRRFSDFAKLFDRLAVEYPACTIPPLPDRWRLEYIAGDRFSNEFTNKRAASLERFLFRVSQHPSLRRSRVFSQFLSPTGGVTGGAASSSSIHEASASGMRYGSGGSQKLQQQDASNIAQESAAIVALDHLGETLMNAFAKARHQSKEMIDARERADRYEQNIATIDKAVVRTSKTQSDLALDFEDMHQQAVKLAQLEPQSGPEFQRLALTAQSLMGSTVQLRHGIDSHFGCALRDMSHYVQALKGMLKQREQRQIDYEALVEYLKRSEHELVAAEHGQTAPAFSSSFLRTKFNELRGVDKEQARQQRIMKLKSRISEFKDESTKAKQVSDDFEELAKREVRVFDQTEAIELQQSLAGLSDSYIEFFQTVLRDCRELEASLD